MGGDKDDEQNCPLNLREVRKLTVPSLPRGWFKVPGEEDEAVIISVLRVTGPTGLVLWALLTENVASIVTGAHLAGFHLESQIMFSPGGEERRGGGTLQSANLARTIKQRRESDVFILL